MALDLKDIEMLMKTVGSTVGGMIGTPEMDGDPAKIAAQSMAALLESMNEVFGTEVSELPQALPRTLADTSYSAGLTIEAEYVVQRPSGRRKALPGPPRIIVAVEESVGEFEILCLFDGVSRKIMSRYVKSRYGMTWPEYLTYCGLPDSYPKVARAYSEQQRANAIRAAERRRSLVLDLAVTVVSA